MTTSAARWANGLAIAVPVLAAATIAGFWLFLKSLDIEAVSSRVERVIEDATGRAFHMGSAPTVQFTPLVKIVINDVTLANMEGGTRPAMLTVRRLELGITLGPLLHGRRPGLRLVLIDPDLLLEVSRSGERNWILKITPEELLERLKQAVEILIDKIDFDAARIEGASVRFEDRSKGAKLEIKARHAALELKPDRRYEFEIDGGVNGKPVAIKANARLPDAGTPITGKIEANAPGATLTAEGVVLPDWPATGSDVKLLVDITDAPALAGMLGASAPKLPPIRLDARLQGGEQGLRADPMQLSLGRSAMTGTVELRRLAPQPLLHAKFHAPVIDLAEIMSPTAAPPETGKDRRIFPDTRLPLDTLRQFDVDARLSVDRLMLPGNHAVEKLEAGVSLVNGRLVAAPLSMNVASGRMSGRVQLDARSAKSVSIDADLNLKQARLGALLAIAGAPGADIRDAPTDVTIRLAASGESLRAWMAGLNGQVRVVTGPGRLPGNTTDWGGSVIGRSLDLLNPFREKDDGSLLKCAVVNVPVRAGIVTVKDTIAGETDKVAGSVAGTADLRQERLDFVLHSKAVSGLGPGLADFASSVKLTGSFAKPELAVHMQGAAVAGLKIGAGVATLGASLLAESLLRKASPPHPCQTALETKP